MGLFECEPQFKVETRRGRRRLDGLTAGGERLLRVDLEEGYGVADMRSIVGAGREPIAACQAGGVRRRLADIAQAGWSGGVFAGSPVDGAIFGRAGARGASARATGAVSATSRTAIIPASRRAIFRSRHRVADPWSKFGLT